MNRDARRDTAAATVAILERGAYTAPSGRQVDIAADLDRAVTGTRLYPPDAALPPGPPEAPGAADGPAPPGGSGAAGPNPPDISEMAEIEVTGETTLAAARRLAGAAPDPICCLNFASAKNPGGGFRSGAQAQEESLARASGLYACLLAAPGYYAFHRAGRDPLYSDHMIYSPAVPVFRDDAGALLDDPYAAAFVTSAAPNAGAVRDPGRAAEIPGVLRRRAGRVLAVARAHGHTRLVLGAWGCGVFRNQPAMVAAAFRAHLRTGPLAGAFTHVVFAVLDTARGRPTHAAFARTFGATGG